MITDVENLRAGTPQSVLNLCQVSTDQNFVSDSCSRIFPTDGIEIRWFIALSHDDIEEIQPFSAPTLISSKNCVHHGMSVFPLTIGQQEDLFATISKMDEQRFSSGIGIDVITRIRSDDTLKRTISMNPICMLPYFFPQSSSLPCFGVVHQRSPQQYFGTAESMIHLNKTISVCGMGNDIPISIQSSFLTHRQFLFAAEGSQYMSVAIRFQNDTLVQIQNQCLPSKGWIGDSLKPLPRYSFMLH